MAIKERRGEEHPDLKNDVAIAIVIASNVRPM